LSGLTQSLGLAAITGALGLKDAEWNPISDFLLQHLIGLHDIQARVHWSLRTIMMFDNRSTIRESLQLQLGVGFNYLVKQIR
jgi:hypothetical protein